VMAFTLHVILLLSFRAPVNYLPAHLASAIMQYKKTIESVEYL